VNYYLDTEFNGFGGALISLALVSERGDVFSRAFQIKEPIEPWVAENVMPIVFADKYTVYTTREMLPHELAGFMMRDPAPRIISDWPDDIRYFCEAIITGPGQMAALPDLTFEVRRVDAYPTDLEGAIQHNACWDAFALRRKLQKMRALAQSAEAQSA
jgi:hypothetical protein